MELFRHREFQILKLFSIAAIVHMAIFGLFSYTVDSEIWSVNLAQYVGKPEFFQFSVYNKPLFYFLLKLIYFFPLGNLETLIAAKTIFVLNGVVLNCLCFRIFKRLAGSDEIAWVGLFFLVINPTWVTECFRIRADFLALSFSLLALSFALKESFASELRRTVWILLCLALSSLCTPKSMIWNLPIFVFLILSEHMKFEKRHWRLLAGMLFGGVCLVALAYWFFLPFQEAVRIAWRHFIEAQAQYSLQNWTSLSMNWILVFNSILAAPVLWSLVLVPLALRPWMQTNGWSKRKNFGFDLLPVFLLALFLFFSAKTAFLWAALLPILILPSILVLKKAFPKIPIQARITITIVSFLIFSYEMVKVDRHQSGISTYQFIRDLNQFTNARKVRIFDSMGLLPRTASIPAYIGFGDSVGNAAASQMMIESPPDIFLNTSRIQVFAPELLQNLQTKDLYIEVQKGLWVKKELLGDQVHQVTQVKDLPNLFNQRVLWRPD
jgi:hypothetical protein